MLTVRIALQQGEFRLDVGLEVASRSTLVLIGESGSGKTTLLRALAGLRRPDRGSIELDGETWFDSERGIDRPAAARSLGYVAQDLGLFPHLDVFENVAFGLRSLRRPGREVRERARLALARLGIPSLARRRVNELSGGQQQRVAIARAIVLEPRLLLLDEPLSSLDVRTRAGVRTELKRLLGDLPCATLYVTHAPGEAMAFGARIAVLEDGRIRQQGTRADLLRAPASRFIAEFLGVNLLRGVVVRGGPGEGAALQVGAARLAIVDPGVDGERYAVVRPNDITLSLEPPHGSARNVLAGRLEDLAPEPPDGALLRARVACDPPLTAEITREAAEALGLAPGLHVHLAFKATSVATFE